MKLFVFAVVATASFVTLFRESTMLDVVPEGLANSMDFGRALSIEAAPLDHQKLAPTERQAEFQEEEGLHASNLRGIQQEVQGELGTEKDAEEGAQKEEIIIRTNTSMFTHKRIQKIVLLPGPHKTGTTSVQHMLSERFRENHPAFTNWSWPVPSRNTWKRYGIKRRNLSKYNIMGGWDREKGHAIFSYRLMGERDAYMPELPFQPLLDVYKETLQQDWEAGKNILIASEGLDLIAAEEAWNTLHKQWINETNGRQTLQQILWNKVIDILPSHPDIEREIVGGILYREGRSKHALSLWHEVGPINNATFAKFIYSNTQFKQRFRFHSFVLNALKLAQIMKESTQVDDIYILNTEGMERNNKIRNIDNSLDLVVACEIMHLPCSQTIKGQWYLLGDEIPIHNRRAVKEKHNVRGDPGKRDLNASTIHSIQRLMHAYDCQFENILNNGKNDVHYLYFNETSPLYSTCQQMDQELSLLHRIKESETEQGFYPAFLPVAEQIRRIACQASIECKLDLQGNIIEEV